MTDKRKYDTIKLLNPAGEWETWKVPRFFNFHDIAERRVHSTLAMYVPRRYRAYGDGETIEGPCWTVWNRAKQEFSGSYEDIERVPWKELWAREGHPLSNAQVQLNGMAKRCQR